TPTQPPPEGAPPTQPPPAGTPTQPPPEGAPPTQPPPAGTPTEPPPEGALAVFQNNAVKVSEVGESAQIDSGQSARVNKTVLDLGTKLHGLNIVADGVTLNFEKLRFEAFQNPPQFESLNRLDLFDSSEIQLDNFSLEQNSKVDQTDSFALSQTNSEEIESTDSSANPTGLIPLPHLLSFDELPEI
ncbi:MAG: hypothetical protein CMQ27_08430, partial [Gammaproteobacteria bacterium]|nr:hypothetical protein [Gammaproteobacteria bacterium]